MISVEMGRPRMGIAGRVVHCRKEPFDVYVGRPSMWGNPFKIGVHGDREEVLRKYEEYVRNEPLLMGALPELRGKTLGCWCSPLPCHGEVLLKLLRELDEKRSGT
jgi:hypothetical protein